MCTAESAILELPVTVLSDW